MSNTEEVSTEVTQVESPSAVLETDMSKRFRGYLPVVIDIETSGFDAQTNAVLELAMITLEFTPEGLLQPKTKIHHHITPFEGAVLCEKSLAFTGIDPFNPLRGAIDEKKALDNFIKPIKAEMKEAGCNRAIIVAHNAHFDHGFLKAAMARCNVKRDPFHPFSSIDTASISAIFYGQTVLAKACKAAGIEFDAKEAHSALYDTEKTAELFCKVVNDYRQLKLVSESQV